MDVGHCFESMSTRAACFVDMCATLKSKCQIPVHFGSAVLLFCSLLLSPLSVLEKDSALDLTKYASYSSHSLKPGIKQTPGTDMLRVKEGKTPLAVYPVNSHGKGNMSMCGWSLFNKTTQCQGLNSQFFDTSFI